MSTTKVTLSLPTEAAQLLAMMHKTGDLQGLPILGLITEVKLDDPRDASMRRIMELKGEARARAMMRASCSYSSPGFAVRAHSCELDLTTREVVWPDGERWPMRLTAKEQAATALRDQLEAISEMIGGARCERYRSIMANLQALTSEDHT